MRAAFLLIILSSMASLTVLQAQSQKPRQRIVPAQGRSEPARSVVAFSNNHSIRLHGNLQTGTSVDVSTTGVGPDFAISVPMEDGKTSLSCQYSVEEREGNYFINYSVSVRARIESGRTSGNVNYEYRDYIVQGNALCTIGSSITIFKRGEESLKLSITKDIESN